MELDKKNLERLLALDDKKFKAVLKKLAGEYGIDASQINIGDADVAKIRMLLSVATEADIQNFVDNIQKNGLPPMGLR